MDLHIKSEEAARLAEEAARLTGESVDDAVTAALRERVTRLRRAEREENLVNDIIEIVESYASSLKGPSIDHAELLYDERGFPR